MQRSRILVLGTLALTLTLILSASVAVAQQVTTPRASPRAELTQTVGLTNIDIVYHRPLVNDRQVWGGIVPYDQVWRAGANENTTITFSHDVKVEGQALAAGTYGVHMIPTQGDWTVIFSKNHTSWGSFSYNQEEDALRVEVKPAEASFREVLTYDFHDLTVSSATLALDWEKVRVPVQIEADTHQVVLASIRNELRSLPGFSWQGWNSAANYCLQNDVNLEEAVTWADNAIQREERFEPLQTKSMLLGKLGKKDEAEVTIAKALEIASPLQLHNYARVLTAQGDPKKALAIFKMNAEKHPETWFVNIGLARGYSAVGEYKKAAEQMRLGATKAPANQKAVYEGLAKQLDEGKAL